MTATGAAEDDFVNVMGDGSTLSYVDDFVVTAPHVVAGQFLKKLPSMWKCAPPTWVTEGRWLKFCGTEMRWQGSDLLIGQPDYAREIVNRYPDLLSTTLDYALAYSPCSAVVDQYGRAQALSKVGVLADSSFALLVARVVRLGSGNPKHRPLQL